MHRPFFKILTPNFYALGAGPGEFLKGQKDRKISKLYLLKILRRDTWFHSHFLKFKGCKKIQDLNLQLK